MPHPQQGSNFGRAGGYKGKGLLFTRPFPQPTMDDSLIINFLRPLPDAAAPSPLIKRTGHTSKIHQPAAVG